MWLKCVLLVALVSAIAGKIPENLNSQYRVDGEYIIALDVPPTRNEKGVYTDKIAEKIEALSDKVTIERKFVFNKVAFLVVRCEDEEVMSQAYDLPEVRIVEANLKQPGIAQNCQSQSTGSNLWGLGRVATRPPPNYSNAQYSYSANDGDTTVAYVVDSGIYINHNDYGGRATRGYTARNLMNSEGEEDLNGHGTHCAGTIMGATYGVAKSARAVAVKIISGDGFYSGSDFLDGVNWMFSDFVQNRNNLGTAYKAVASMSLGGGASNTNDLAVRECIDAGLSAVVAAMNENTNACAYSPARMTDAITVGATDINERLATFSNWGNCVDILGPGVNILSTFIGSPTATQIYSGTSMATPHVAGAILRYMTQIGFRPSPATVRSWLVASSTPNAIDLRGQTATPNLMLYAPCSLSSQETDGVVHAVGDYVMEEDRPAVMINHHHPGHHPGHPPGHEPVHSTKGPNMELEEIMEMKRMIEVVYEISIGVAVVVGLLFLVTVTICCNTILKTDRAKSVRRVWYQSNIANEMGKPKPKQTA